MSKKRRAIRVQSKLKRVRSNNRQPVCLAAILSGIAALASATQQEEVAALLQHAVEDEAIEEITVYGEQSMSSLRFEINRAEENFFELFSELNDDDEFDVRCFYEMPTGTKRRFHVCRAQFVTDAYSRAAARFLGGVSGPYQDPEVVVMQKSGELERRMTTLISQNPELKEALDRYTDTRVTYETEKSRRYPGSADESEPEQ